MEKKGFTLVEALAVIIILSILALILVPSVNKIRKDILNRTYTSRVNMIKSAALNWANDNLVEVPSHVTSTYFSQTTCDSDCKCVTVQTLIDGNYLSGSDNDRKVMKNPVTKQSMNNKNVCVRYNNNEVLTRKLVAYLVE